MYWFSRFSSSFSKISEVRSLESVGPEGREVTWCAGSKAEPPALPPGGGRLHEQLRRCPWMAGGNITVTLPAEWWP